MNTELVGCEILHLEETDSTNTEIKELARQKKLPEGFCLYTDYQRLGRGQYGKQWQSPKGQNLLMSVYLLPSFLPAEESYRLTMSVCLALLDLGKHLGFESQIKWPNDWYYGQEKIAGVLMEGNLQAGTLQSCIIGMGVNVKQRSFGLLNASSLERIVDHELDMKQIRERLCECLDQRYRQLRLGFKEKQAEEFNASLMGLKGQSFRWKDQELKGKVLSAEADGELRIEFESGEIRKFRHREIDFIFD